MALLRRFVRIQKNGRPAVDKPVTLDVLRGAVGGAAVALRCVTKYQPVGGPAVGAALGKR